MKAPNLSLWCLLWATTLFAQEPTLDDLRGRYEEHQKVLQQKHLEGPAVKLNQQYVGRLDQLSDSASKAGKLDAVLIIRKEKERFTEEKIVMQADVRKEVPPLAKTQAEFMAAYARILKDRQTREAKLNQAYAKTLMALKVNLTKAQKIEEAVAVDTELKKVLPRPAEGNQIAGAARDSFPPPRTPTPAPAPKPRKDRNLKIQDEEIIGEWTIENDKGDHSNTVTFEKIDDSRFRLITGMTFKGEYERKGKELVKVRYKNDNYWDMTWKRTKKGFEMTSGNYKGWVLYR